MVYVGKFAMSYRGNAINVAELQGGFKKKYVATPPTAHLKQLKAWPEIA